MQLDFSGFRPRVWLFLLGCVLSLFFPALGVAQSLGVHNSVKTFTGLTNTVVAMSGRSELRITGTGDPIPGCIIHLNSPDSWILFTRVLPSQASFAFLSRVRVNGSAALPEVNVRVVQFAQGAVIIPHGPDFSPLEVFSGRFFTGTSRRFGLFEEHSSSSLGFTTNAVSSFRLKRGYMATFAQQSGGNGISRCYVAQDGDLEISVLPTALQNNVRYVRVFPWRWTSKKGIAGNIESGLNLGWLYNWNLDRNSPLDWEYIPIRQTRWWPGLDQDWKARGSTHLLGYNEPDRPDQANMTVADAIGAWPDVLWPGLRVGAPAVSDGGLNWLYDFMSQADAANLRVDFVPVHYYRCYGNVGDPAGTANQFYNFLKGIYDTVKRPLWVTEWNNGANWTGCADPTFAQQEAAVQAMIDMLESTPFVERYALYNWVEDVRRVKWDDGSLTAAGVRYRDKVSSLAYRQEMPDSGVGSSARYSFDGDTHDAWGNGQDAMRVGAPAFAPGKHGQAIALNGTTDYLQVSPRLGDSTDWSFAGWVFWEGGGNWQRIFDLGDDTTHYLFLSPRTSGGSLRFAINNGGGEQQLSAPPLAVGVWTHVAVTISGNTGKMFVNGLPVATNTSMSINPGDVGTKYNYLGRSRFSADPLFAGRFDDFRFVSSALTEAQVAAIVNTPPPQFIARILYKSDATAQQPYTDTLAGDAVGTGALTFSKMEGPAWLAVAANGSLTGTPALTNAGWNSFIVRVTDPNGSLHTATLLIYVTAPSVNFAMAVGADSDDAEESAGGEVTLDSTDLELVRDDATSSGNQWIGLRFNYVSVPRGAIITSARLQFTADESQSEATALQIFAEATDHAATFKTTANNLSFRALVPLRVNWTLTPWTAGQSNAAQLTPNLAGLVQEITSRPGWVSGNAIAFLITGTGHRTAEAADKSGGFPARLLIEYSLPTPLYSITVPVTSSSDDAEQSAAGVVTLDSTDLELVRDDATSSGDQTVGLRFPNLPVPADAVLSSAYLQFIADETNNTSTALTLRAEAADNAATFTSTANNISARPLTTSSVSWAPAAWNAVDERGSLQRTPDLSSLVNEIISRPGWSNGHALAFIITGTGQRTVDAADEIGGTPATFNVNYWKEIPAGTYARWAAQTNAGSPGEDLDGDRYDNLLEYGLGLDPLVPDRAATPLIVNGGFLEFTYSRPAAVTDLSYQVQWADQVDATVWSSTGVIQTILSDDGTHRIIRAMIPRGAGTQRFVRLKLTR